MKKIETVEEYLARGGTIKRIDAVVEEQKPQPVKSTKVGPVVILSLEDADLIYGEKTKRKKKKKPVNLSEVPMELIPEELKKSLGI